MGINEIIEKHQLWLNGEEGGSRANLRDADLRGANLRSADLWSLTGNKSRVKSLQLEKYDITYTSQVMQIDCQQHGISEWRAFSDEEIDDMDGSALDWWKKWKSTIKSIIEMSPAE